MYESKKYRGVRPVKYKSIIKEHMELKWVDWFDGMQIILEDDGTTTL